MDTIITVVEMTPRPGGRDALLAALQMVAQLVRAEDGCELYALHTTDDTVAMVGRWRDRAALDAHAKGDAVKRLRAATVDLVGAPSSIRRLTPDGGPAIAAAPSPRP